MSNAALHDAPWDFTRQRETHRYPPAVHLRRDVAAEERAHAQHTLNAVNDSASVRVGLTGGLALGGLLAVAVLALGNDELTGAILLKLGVLGALLGLSVTTLAGLVHRHMTTAGQLAARVQIYEARLAEIDGNVR